MKICKRPTKSRMMNSTQNYRKWVRIFNILLYVPDTPKAKLLREKVKYFFWKLEWRMLCCKWYGDKAEQSSFWVASLK